MSEEDIRKYEQMMQESPQSRAFAPLAEAYRKTGRLDDAIRVAETGLKIHPDYSGGLVVLGRALYEKGELEKAAQALEKAVRENPESYLGQKLLGKVLLERGEAGDARSALEAANFLSPDDGEVEKLLDGLRREAAPAGPVEVPEESFGDEGAEEIAAPEGQPEGAEGEGLLVEAQSPDVEGADASALTAGGEKGFPGDADAAIAPADRAETPLPTDEEFVEELGPEAVAFLEDADVFEEEVVIVPEENGVPSAQTAAPEASPQPRVEGSPEEEDAGGESGYETVPLEEEPFPAMREKGSPIVVTPPSFTASGLQHPKGSVPREADEDLASSDIPVSPGEGLSTETLGDLYARQGMRDKAAEIYRKILVHRPGEEGVRRKLEALEGEGALDVRQSLETPEEPGGADGEKVFKGDDDPLAILQSWLENAERMKKP